jgi:hypothetical protein
MIRCKLFPYFRRESRRKYGLSGSEKGSRGGVLVMVKPSNLTGGGGSSGGVAEAIRTCMSWWGLDTEVRSILAHRFSGMGRWYSSKKMTSTGGYLP